MGDTERAFKWGCGVAAGVIFAVFIVPGVLCVGVMDFAKQARESRRKAEEPAPELHAAPEPEPSRPAPVVAPPPARARPPIKVRPPVAPDLPEDVAREKLAAEIGDPAPEPPAEKPMPRTDPEKAAASLLKAAKSLLAQGNRDGARRFLQNVEDRYPDSTSAEEARALLKRIGN